ncbi:hypothetical protein ACSBR2_002285 [Camellia fascicularis]
MKYVNNPYCIGLVSKFCKCAYAPVVFDSNQKLEQFVQFSHHFVINFLKDLDPRHWANALVDAIRIQIMNQMVDHRGASTA